jgi:hypothetical protein
MQTQKPTPAADGAIDVTLPCGEVIFITREEWGPSQLLRPQCPTCGQNSVVIPVTNTVMDIIGSYGPRPESGITVLVGKPGELEWPAEQ